MSGLFRARVIEKVDEGSGIIRLVLDEPELAEVAQPGQFLNLRVSSSTSPLLRRPISIHWVEQGQVEILFQVIGQGTEMLAKVRMGEELDVLGPLGRGFGPFTDDCLPVLVGGGIGIAPLGLLAQRLAGKEIICILGARDAQTLAASGGDKLKKLGVKIICATDDGSAGHKGFVTDLLAQNLPTGAKIYACGPNPMLRAVAKFALAEGIPCQVSLEEHMGCGVGACLGCVCKGASSKGKEIRKRVCIDGPVFEVQEVDWA